MKKSVEVKERMEMDTHDKDLVRYLDKRKKTNRTVSHMLD